MKKRVLIKRAAVPLLICIFTVIFVMMPFPASGLTVRLYFGDMEGEEFEVLYTADPDFDMELANVGTKTLDREHKVAVMRVTPELADHLIYIRFNFPKMEQVVSIVNVSVSGAGVIRHFYNPCDFFAEENILDANDISQISLIESRETAYIKTGAEDPYIIMENGLVLDLLGHRSTFRRTRLAICILIFLGYLSWHLRLFGTKREK